jgi:hypothetical protein
MDGQLAAKLPLYIQYSRCVQFSRLICTFCSAQSGDNIFSVDPVIKFDGNSSSALRDKSCQQKKETQT